MITIMEQVDHVFKAHNEKANHDQKVIFLQYMVDRGRIESATFQNAHGDTVVVVKSTSMNKKLAKGVGR